MLAIMSVGNGAAEETIIVTFSPKYKDYQRKIREGLIERARKMITTDGKIRKTEFYQTGNLCKGDSV